jgi:hypothetical protein
MRRARSADEGTPVRVMLLNLVTSADFGRTRLGACLKLGRRR